jgi:hypothetical protein
MRASACAHVAFSDYTTALATFVASPTTTNKATVLQYRLGLPDEVSSDGGTVKLPKIDELTRTLDAVIADSAASDRRRFIRAGVRHG